MEKTEIKQTLERVNGMTSQTTIWNLKRAIEFLNLNDPETKEILDLAKQKGIC